MSVLLFLHVTALVLGFAMLIAYGTVCHVVARSNHAEFARLAFKAVGELDLAGRLLIIAGLILGLLLARPFGYDAPWLLASDVLMALAILNGALILEPFQKRLMAAAVAGTTPLLPPQRSNLALYANIAGFFFWTASIWLMIAKPGIVQ
ncbi:MULTISPECIES: DUF2269 family protein [unclassified Janthinobacterium]|uniref:DUF2269 family protein n=1 Tax=unclassified Janthinobacterium TaxID=2610881 RepID=UPI00160D5A99|nr:MULTISPECIES: DUF2269 family protein [unclassified Janthinobacterium]MBB5607051.1 hypothetical protein [Janthinobacterium sp. S3T4]MBB5612777.1 hypothetical protein [Janthinobacterium sp. S3M3]